MIFNSRPHIVVFACRGSLAETEEDVADALADIEITEGDYVRKLPDAVVTVLKRWHAFCLHVHATKVHKGHAEQAQAQDVCWDQLKYSFLNVSPCSERFMLK
jgi:hypothetical protein